MGGARFVAHQNADAALFDFAQSVLIGEIVAEVDGHHVAPVEIELLQQPGEGFALVPVDIGAQFENHFAARLAEPITLGKNFVDRSFDLRPLIFSDPPEMHGDGEFLALHLGSVDLVEALVQSLFRLVQRRQIVASLLKFQLFARRTGDVEPVAAGIVNIADAGELLDILAVAAADDGDRAVAGQVLDGLAHFFGNDRLLGAFDNGSEGAVVVEEHRRSLAFETAGDVIEAVEDRGEDVGRFPAAVRLDADFGKVLNHDIGEFCQFLFLVGTVDADHQPEPAGPAGLHSRLGVLDDNRALRLHPQLPGRRQKHVGGRFAGNPQLFGIEAIDPGFEQVAYAGRVKHLAGIFAGGNERGLDSGIFQCPDELDG